MVCTTAQKSTAGKITWAVVIACVVAGVNCFAPAGLTVGTFQTKSHALSLRPAIAPHGGTSSLVTTPARPGFGVRMSAAVPSEPRENIKWDYTRPPDDPEGFKDLSDHIADVKRLAKQLADRKEGQMITLQRGKGDSHCPRAFTYKEETLQLDLSNMTGLSSDSIPLFLSDLTASAQHACCSLGQHTPRNTPHTESPIKQEAMLCPPSPSPAPSCTHWLTFSFLSAWQASSGCKGRCRGALWRWWSPA